MVKIPSPSAADWIAGARPRTLPMSVCPVLVGSAAAYAMDSFQPVPALLALIIALLLQIGVNYANDYSDGVRETDSARVGPMRLVGSGRAPARSVLRAALLSFAGAAVCGLVLVLMTSSWWFLLVGGACIVAAWTYTGGQHPYGYSGLGDVAVFVFFGLVATLGTTITQAGGVSSEALVGAAGTGLIAVALLMVNNIRDIPSDTAAGKRTVAVRLGQVKARRLYVALIGAALVLPVVLVGEQPWALLTLLMLPCALRPCWTVLGGAQGKQLIPILQQTSLVNIGFSVLYALGLLLEPW